MMSGAVEIIGYLEELNLISVCVRIFLSILCGGIIGFERGRAHQPAGMRTHMLVCMGSAIVMLTGQYMFYHFQSGDPARLGAQVISGIGFLGAGSIITSGDSKIRGLTTAAGLWTAACIGLSIGIGFYEAGIVATLAVSLIMTQLKKLEYRRMVDDLWLSIYVELDAAVMMSELAEKLAEFGLEIGEVQPGKKRKGFQKAVINIKNKEHKSRGVILRYIQGVEGIQFVKYTS